MFKNLNLNWCGPTIDLIHPNSTGLGIKFGPVWSTDHSPWSLRFRKSRNLLWGFWGWLRPRKSKKRLGRTATGSISSNGTAVARRSAFGVSSDTMGHCSALQATASVGNLGSFESQSWTRKFEFRNLRKLEFPSVPSWSMGWNESPTDLDHGTPEIEILEISSQDIPSKEFCFTTSPCLGFMWSVGAPYLAVSTHYGCIKYIYKII